MTLKTAPVLALLVLLAGCKEPAPCLRHEERETVSYYQSGNLLLPIYGSRKVCVERAE